MKRKILFVFLALSFSVSEFLAAQNLLSSSLSSQHLKNSDSSKSSYQTRSWDEDEDENEKNVSEKDELGDLSFSASAQEAMSNPDYLVTAGDIYSLTYAANGTAVSYTIVVDSTYKIRVSNLAILDAAGKSYATLKKQVEEIVSKNYPLSGAQFVLTTPALYKIVVNGEVKKTVERSVWALTRLSQVVDGTTTDYSSLRNISVSSANGKKKTYDLFKADRDGDLSENPYLRPGDVITVNRISRVASISGSVERPGTYELLDGENLKELVEYYGGGFTELADTRSIELTRFLNNGEGLKSGQKIYLSKTDFDSDYELKSYDSVFIYSYELLKPVIFVEGAVDVNSDVNLEGSARRILSFEYGTDYVYLIRNNSILFTSSIADRKNAYVIRAGKTIPLDIDEILFNANSNLQLKVEPNDTIIVPFRQFFVTVSGAVNNPGRFPYIPDRKADYYVGLAGGFNKEKNSGNKMKIVDISGNKLSESDFILPESMITVESNSFTYYFNRYSGVITTVASLITTTISVITVVNANW